MQTTNAYSDFLYIGIIVFLGWLALYVEEHGLTFKAIAPAVLVVVFTIISVLFTTSGETIIATFYKTRWVVLFIVISAVLYGIAQSLNTKPDGGVYYPNSLIALGWNGLNALGLAIITPFIDARFAYLPMPAKVACFAVIFFMLVTFALLGYVNHEIDKVPV